jgi:hypothetical protein
MSTVVEDPPFNAASATGAELAAVAAFAGVPATQQTSLDPNEYQFFEAICYKFNGGLRGMVDLIVYAGCVGGFISLQVSNSSLYTDIGVLSNGVTIPFDSNIPDYARTISYIVMIGVVLSLIRIIFADKFMKEVKLNRILELVWGLIIWLLFVIGLIITYIIRGKLSDALARTSNPDNSSPDRQKAISLAQKQVDAQLVIMGLSVGATTILTIYNIYDLFQAEQLKIGAGIPPATPPPS